MTKALYSAPIEKILENDWEIQRVLIRQPENLIDLFQLVYPERSWTKSRLKEIFSNPNIKATWLAECPIDYKIIGHCSLKIEESEAHVHWLAVDPEWRQRGIGRALIRHAARWCRNNWFFRLSAWSTTVNNSVHRFYLDNKFEELSEEHAHEYQRVLHRLYSARTSTPHLRDSIAEGEALWPGEGDILTNPSKFGNDIY